MTASTALDIEQLLNKLPEILRDGTRLALERLFEQPELILNAEIVPTLPLAFACSEYVAETLVRYPELTSELFASGDLLRALEAGELEARCSEVTAELFDAASIKRALRLFRHRELVRIAWRDVCGLAELADTLRELSELADAFIGSALRWVEGDLFDRYGKPVAEDGTESQFVVLAMGKLGGGELNFSSDIDLVFLFSEAGETNGRQSVTAPEYFRLVAQRFIKVLDERTADGFVYRVDVRLRPFGTSGPLAVSESAFEEYLMTHGRDWERYAYVKARVANHWDGADDFYEQVLRPFVYRRYLDYGVFSSLREMKAMIETEGRKKGMQNHVKLGPGGIREIEFIVQTLQLVRGGTIVQLRERRLLPALQQLGVHRLLPEQAVTELTDAYCYLRLIENHIQAIQDRQTHELPTSDQDRARICLSMGVKDWDALMITLEDHRDKVQEHFNSTLRRASDDAEPAAAASGIGSLWIADEVGESALDELAELGFKHPESVSEQLKRLKLDSAIQRLDEPGRARLNRLMPEIIMACAAEAVPDAALDGCLKVVEAIGRRSAYFALLNENPAALKRLVGLVARSEFLANQIAVHPLLLDELLDPRVFSQAPTRADFAADLRVRIGDSDTDDAEQRLGGIRNFQQAAVFRTAVADLSGIMPLMHVSDRLTDIGELVVQAALELSLGEMLAKHGKPMCDDGSGLREASFGVLGYGKLGGFELGYGSDLDLVFLHDSAGEEQQTDGEHSLENTVFFARLTQRLINMLTMRTISGILYEVDVRLRPNGNSGQMVSSLEAFDSYQHNDAWTWEHQSLLRSRLIAGPDPIRTKFASLRDKALTEYVHFDDLRADVLKMRERMHVELDKSTATEMHIKHGKGGVVDIEFLVQYLVLANARNHSALILFSDNIRQLEALAEAGILKSEDSELLAEVYREYRSWLHRCALVSKTPLIAVEELGNSPQQVIELWQCYLEKK
ncbi:MAG: bifunctional [glutamate--ammonia ligase]-adenylyl-L-tyrosine phosphorylase/[glutamate--ammonia-ligase] adenylyltransferase [Gammaproteobacteria bacterium]|nr:bifunctional [glutamate--ammonia ligase]-adenylyl-L-tyrosine phosphorylase/[glutamate--ammonia-ligase] adenylyltransferase [Gammaproteobacteria bacterium]